MSDQLIRFVTRNSHFRAIAAETSALCETARRLHGTDPTATVALARATTGTALMGGLLKGDQRLALSIEGNGPLQRLQAETDANGHIRCSIKNPLANLPPRDNNFDVANAIGKAGFLNIIKDLGLKEPYYSTVQLQTSEIGDDIAYYLTTSEQVPSSVSLGVLLGPDAEVKVAGGFIIQALPGCNDEAIEQIEAKINSLPGISSLLRDGESPGTILEAIFSDFDCSDPESIPLTFRCNCSQRQVAGVLKGMGPEELSSLAEKGEAVDVTCEYCRQAYRFSPEDLSALSG
jgi:molecular chaperone Hsp33